MVKFVSNRFSAALADPAAPLGPRPVSVSRGPGLENAMVPRSQASGHRPLSDEEVLRLRRRLERSVASVCPLSMADLREDLVQDALLKVLRILESRPADAELNATYLWRTAYCALVDELRVLRRRSEVALGDPEGDDPGPALESPEPGPARKCRSAEIRRAFDHCLGLMAESRRLAVILHLQGESAGDAADLLGWAKKRVYNLTFRGLQDLRGCLEKRGVTP